VPTLQLVGDAVTNPQLVDVADVGAGRQPPPAGGTVPVRLTTQAMLRLAAQAALQGMRVQSLRLDDASRQNHPELEDLQLQVVRHLRNGNHVAAGQLLMAWPGALVITELSLHDRRNKLVLHFSRNGEVSFGGGSTEGVMDALVSVVRPHPEIFSS
jgi:hypothetical protein